MTSLQHLSRDAFGRARHEVGLVAALFLIAGGLPGFGYIHEEVCGARGATGRASGSNRGPLRGTVEGGGSGIVMVTVCPVQGSTILSTTAPAATNPPGNSTIRLAPFRSAAPCA